VIKNILKNGDEKYIIQAWRKVRAVSAPKIIPIYRKLEQSSTGAWVKNTVNTIREKVMGNYETLGNYLATQTVYLKPSYRKSREKKHRI